MRPNSQWSETKRFIAIERPTGIEPARIASTMLASRGHRFVGFQPAAGMSLALLRGRCKKPTGGTGRARFDRLETFPSHRHPEETCPAFGNRTQFAGIMGGTALARSNVMPILEARFYPRSKADPSFVVVGRVMLEDGLVAIEPASLSQRSISPFDGDGLQLKLRFIVDCATTDPYPELLHLRSDYWAFVDPTRPSQPSQP